MSNNDEDFELWFAELKRKEAENALAREEKIMERAKGKASSIMNWSISLSLAMITVTLSNINRYWLISGIDAFLFMVTAVMCVYTLYSSSWDYPDLEPDHLSLIEDDEKTKKEVYRLIIENMSEKINKNKKRTKYLSFFVNIIFIVFVSAPIFSCAIFLTYLVRSFIF